MVCRDLSIWDTTDRVGTGAGLKFAKEVLAARVRARLNHKSLLTARGGDKRELTWTEIVTLLRD
jgi:hypothetical protein